MARAKPAGAPPQGGRRGRIWLLLAAILAIVALVVVGLAGWAYWRLNSNIGTVDPNADNALGDTRPAKENEAMNILAIGSDSRAGANDFVGGDSPGLADTTMVVHLAADNSWAAGVSIPRDSMVQMPSCVTPSGSTRPGGFRQFNEAFQIGGAVCVQRTVEATTGLHIDHFVQIDFAGFAQMVDAVGGVPVYIPKTIDDPNSKIHFEPGCHLLNGKQALQYVRVRHGVDDGSDTSRIKRQQQFLASLIQQVTSAGTLTNPLELYRFLDAATKAVTTDTELGGIRNMAGVAVRVRSIGLSAIEFTTVPTGAWEVNPNRLVWQQPGADKMWKKLRQDKPLSPQVSASPSASASDSPSKGSSKSPSPTATKTPKPTASGDSRTADQPICPELP